MHIEQFGVNIPDESRRCVILHPSITETILSARQYAMLLCPSDGHIEQPALFFEFAHRVGTHRRREDVLFEAHDKHRGKFQALR